MNGGLLTRDVYSNPIIGLSSFFPHFFIKFVLLVVVVVVCVCGGGGGAAVDVKAMGVVLHDFQVDAVFFAPIFAALSPLCASTALSTHGDPSDNSTGCNDVMVFFFVPAYCVLGHRKCFVGNHIAIILFFKTENWCAARRVVNLNRNGTMGTQEQDEIPPSSGSR